MLPVEQVIDLAKMYVMYNYTNGNLPHGAFANTWPTNRERRREGNQTNLRNDEDLYVPLPVRKICMYQCGRSVQYVPFARTNTIGRLPLMEFPRSWNNIFPDNNLKFELNSFVFKNKLESVFLDINLTALLTAAGQTDLFANPTSESCHL